MSATVAAGVGHRQSAGVGALLGVLGVVYGDIGTSPLYAFKTSLEHFAGSRIGSLEVLGILSLIFWSLIIIVTCKYVLVVMRADNRGEGGILALMALAQRVAGNPRMRTALALVGITGASLFFGDGVITPAISVLSAVEGLETVAPHLASFVVPISAIVIVVLFMVQSRGTGSVGRVFGPVMVVWFFSIGFFGAIAIARHPGVLAALSPTYGLLLCAARRAARLRGARLGGAGGDRRRGAVCRHGPFRRRIRSASRGCSSCCRAWCSTISARARWCSAIRRRWKIRSFCSCPNGCRLPMVILATAATVIASQALISGAYSIARQCIQLGFLPRMTVLHTSASEEGQIYVPQVNVALLVGVLLLVFAFRDQRRPRRRLRHRRHRHVHLHLRARPWCSAASSGWSRWLSIAVFGAFFLIDTIFFAANALKMPEGGWVPLVLGVMLLIADDDLEPRPRRCCSRAGSRTACRSPPSSPACRSRAPSGCPEPPCS